MSHLISSPDSQKNQDQMIQNFARDFSDLDMSKKWVIMQKILLCAKPNRYLGVNPIYFFNEHLVRTSSLNISEIETED